MEEKRGSRRSFLWCASVAATGMAMPRGAAAQQAVERVTAADREHIRTLAAWTSLTFDTPNPVPYGAEIVRTGTRERLMREANAVGAENDPSAHAELRTIRLACAKLKTPKLSGYTLYTTCEPCPMCMACALWAGLDRVVYGATIADAARFGHQIIIPAAEVAKRTDMRCVVDGPVEEDACLALFTDPRMRRQFDRWNER